MDELCLLDISFLALDEGYLAAIIFRPYGEMNPIVALLIPLYQDFIEVAPGAVGDVKQGVGIAEGLLYALASDIHSTSREMVRGWRSAS